MQDRAGFKPCIRSGIGMGVVFKIRTPMVVVFQEMAINCYTLAGLHSPLSPIAILRECIGLFFLIDLRVVRRLRSPTLLTSVASLVNEIAHTHPGGSSLSFSQCTCQSN